MITLVVLLALIPIVLLIELLRALARWRRVPLQTKNQVRAGLGGFLVTLAIGACAEGLQASMPPISGYVVGGLAAFGLLYLVVGIHGAHGARFDFMSAFWWAVVAIGCVGLLVFKGVLVS